MYEFKNIPQELKNAPQWILWRSEERDGKKTKVPYQIDGSMAQSSNKRTWSTFPTIIKFYNKRDYDGIGFMFSKDDPFIGIDIDHCVEDGVLSPFAQEIVDSVGSYTEFSPSGEGVHIITKGKIPLRGQGTGRKNPELGLEVYRHGRYFTFTGNSLGIGAIEERSDKLKELFDKYLKDKKEETKISSPPAASSRDMYNLSNKEIWDRMFNSKNGKGIQDLFNGHLINDDHSATDMALCNHLAFWTDKDTSKMDSMFRETGLYREKWDRQHSSDGATYGEMTIAAAVYSTHKTISDLMEEQQDQPYEVYISHPDNSQVEDTEEIIDTPPVFHLTELGNAERLVYYHGKNIRYCNELEWLIWNGKMWEEDSKRKIEALAAQTLRAIYGEAKATEDGYKKKQLNDWAKKCERRNIRMNTILDTRPMVAVKKEELDSHKYLFNCENGVIDLKTGAILPHDRDLLFTKISSVAYEKDADCPNWKAFLESIFIDEENNPNYEIINFMQKAIGYALTGDTSEQVMFFLFGNGRNGKSTFINTVQQLLGDYGRQTNSDTFIKKKNDSSINNDIARLDGARFVSAVESEEGQQLSESLVKQITGGEKMSARFLRQEYFEFTPEFKVFFTTNHKPIVKGSDEGIWRRIRLVPFTVTIPKEKVDKKLPQKLAAEMPGILRWAVEGCLKWQKEGLKEPEVIRKATEGYREDMDILGPFLAERCVIHPASKVESKEIYKEYKNWCYENDDVELKNRAFYRQLEIRGFKKETGAKNKLFFMGIGLQKLQGHLNFDERVSKGVSEPTTKNNITPMTRKKL
ncbi:phage/plasmid primase, P4 family [Bacillus pumilus]|uniref:phage/plasmid primase, P4 family n=1 Tax=Bacillus pumilus TaxID=1408 RepID=UPI0015D56498|nr:phage/plasmid primase, P4 family [Bacillus pumilus]QLI78221.1 DNA primase [Bacillus pumilus]